MAVFSDIFHQMIDLLEDSILSASNTHIEVIGLSSATQCLQEKFK